MGMQDEKRISADMSWLLKCMDTDTETPRETDRQTDVA